MRNKVLFEKKYEIHESGITVSKRSLNNDFDLHTHDFYERTDVTFYPVSRIELLSYIDTGDPLDKAGAYGIQGPFAIHIKEISGDYNNVVGLPIGRLYQEMKNLNLL